MPDSKLNFIIIENEYLSPDFKYRLQLLKDTFNFTYELLNFPWPEEIVTKEYQPGRVSLMYRLLFLDQIFHPEVKTIMYKDAD